MKLDEIARRSSEAARAGVRHLDPPPVGPPIPIWRRPALLIASVVVLVAGVGGAWSFTRSGGEEGDQIFANDGAIPRLGIDVPDDWRVDSAFDLPFGVELESTPETLAFFGDEEADDPYANGGLVIVLSTPGAGSLSGDEADRTEVTVRGTKGIAFAGSDSGQPNMGLDWVEPNGPNVTMQGVHLDRATMQSIAEGLTIDGSAGAWTVALNDAAGLDELTTFVLKGSFGLGSIGLIDLGTAERGSTIVYTAPDEASSIVMAVRDGTTRDAVVINRWFSSRTTTTTVNGEAAWLFSRDFDGPNSATNDTLVWSPRDGVVASVSTYGPEADSLDLVSLAENATEIDEETWKSYLVAHEQSQAIESFDVVYGSGSYEGPGDSGPSKAIHWGIGTRDGDLCVEIAYPGGGGGTCDTLGHLDSDDARVIIATNFNDLAIALLTAAPDVSIRAIGRDGVMSEGQMTRFESGGNVFSFSIGPADPDRQFEVTRNGEVINVLDGQAVEAIRTAPAELDPTTNTAAISLGIADSFQQLLIMGSDPITVAAGLSDDSLCLITTGPNGDTASCGAAGADISVLKPIPAGAGATRSFVVVRELPKCIVGIDGAGVSTTGSGTGSYDGDTKTAALIIGEGPAVDWQLTALRDDGSRVEIPLPDLEGNASWPATVCAG